MHTKYKHLFFDLDRTLWDFDTNNKLTFAELFDEFKLERRGIYDTDGFYNAYLKINIALWDKYKRSLITRDALNFNRFYESLLLYNVSDARLAEDMGRFYIANSPLKTVLYPQTIETLEKLQQKYQMHIITNGFEDVQFIKIEKSGLSKYFNKIITSEKAGFKKPDPKIFWYALKETGAEAIESIIIGDDPDADILGAQQIGMDQIWVKHPPVIEVPQKPTFEVSNICDITSIL